MSIKTNINSLLPSRNYICNFATSKIPIYNLRIAALRLLGIKLGKETNIMMHTEFYEPRKIIIGDKTTVGNWCSLDGRGGLTIGNRCNISSYSVFVSGTHDVQSPDFFGNCLPIRVDDYAWICTRATILGGVTIGKGSVVAAGAVVTRSVPPFTIVAGVPAKPIGTRSTELDYSPAYLTSWT
jgi:acetyltransferase-like isoleucine patch superfamily enzyme